jgi:hypothetical protein
LLENGAKVQYFSSGGFGTFTPSTAPFYHLGASSENGGSFVTNKKDGN